MTGTTDRAARVLARHREIQQHLNTTLPGIFERHAPKPLALGTTRSLIEQVPDIPPWELRAFIRFWCSRRRYLEAVARGGARFDLDGKAAGEVSEPHQVYAFRQLDRWP
jgi:ProP effector